MPPIARSRRRARCRAGHAVATGYEAEDHFPGAALLYAADDSAATALAAPAQARPARSPCPTCRCRRRRAVHRRRRLDPPGARRSTCAAPARSIAAARCECLTTAIYYEAATEPDAGQQAVAQVILNRVRHPAFPATVCGVVYQGSERAAAASSASPATARWRAASLRAQLWAPRDAGRGGGARRLCLRAGRAGDALPHLCRYAGVEPQPGDDRGDRRAFLPPLAGLVGHARRVPPDLCRWRAGARPACAHRRGPAGTGDHARGGDRLPPRRRAPCRSVSSPRMRKAVRRRAGGQRRSATGRFADPRSLERSGKPLQ